MEEEMDKNLAESQVAIFIISIKLLAAKHFPDLEQTVIKRVENGKLTLIPILYRPANWEAYHFAKLNAQPLPKNGRYLSQLSKSDRELELVSIAKEILNVTQPTKTPVLHLKKIIAEGNIEEALNQTEQAIQHSNNKDLQNEIIHLKSNYFQVNKDYRRGIITSETLRVQNRKTVDVLLELIDNIDGNASSNTTPTSTNGTGVAENITQLTTKKFLYLTSCPDGKSPVGFAKEHTAIDDALQDSRMENQVKLQSKLQVKANELFLELHNADNPNYIHLSVHGERPKPKENLPPFLLFVKKDDQTARISPTELAGEFEELAKDNSKLELVCISACNSLKHATAIAKFAPYVIGMNGKIPVDAAILFANVFYKRLFVDQPIEFAFKQALNALRREDYPDQDGIKVHEMPHLFSNFGKEVFVLTD